MREEIPTKRLCVALLLILLGISPGLANARTLLLVGGEGGYAHLEDEEIVTAFNGYFAGYDPRISVLFPGDATDLGHSMEVGTASLYEAIKVQQAAGNKMTIGGVSQGAPAVDDVLRLLADDPDAPGPEDLDVFVYGPFGRDSFFWGQTAAGYTYLPPPETPYTVTVVFAEYDGAADMPDNLFNLLAVVNAYMGAEQLHVEAVFDPASDLTKIPLEYIWKETNSQGGTTWTIVIPTTELPILEPLRELGVDPVFISLLDGLLRPIIDSAYIRNFLPNAQERPPAPDTSTSTPALTEPLNPEAATLALNTGPTPVDRRHVTAAEEATHAKNALPPATTKASDEPDTKFDTAPDATAAGQPAGATDLTDGNKFQPGLAATANPTDQDTDVVEHAKEKEPRQISPANRGPTTMPRTPTKPATPTEALVPPIAGTGAGSDRSK